MRRIAVVPGPTSPPLAPGIDRPRRGPTLLWRIFLVNAAVLIGDGLLIALAPPALSSPRALTDAAALLLGIATMLALTFLLSRQAFAPLYRLRDRVADIDRLPAPQQQLPDDSAVREVAELTRAFNAMLERLEAERRRSDARALAAQERERRRLSRELHDEVGQTLSAALMTLSQGPEPLPAAMRERLDSAATSVRTGLDSARRIAHELRPQILDQMGLTSGLAGLARRMGAAGDLDVELDLPAALPPLAEEIEIAVYRVAQEALTNVTRHARATMVRLSLGVEDDIVELTVRDDGRGLAAGTSDGHGVRGMAERASDVGGTFLLRNVFPTGTEVVLRAPRHVGVPA